MSYIHVRIADREALKSVPMANVVPYIESTGWAFVDTVGHRRIMVYRKESEDQSWTIWVPDHNNYADHAYNMGYIIRELAQSERRSELDVFVELGGSIQRD